MNKIRIARKVLSNPANPDISTKRRYRALQYLFDTFDWAVSPPSVEPLVREKYLSPIFYAYGKMRAHMARCPSEKDLELRLLRGLSARDVRIVQKVYVNPEHMRFIEIGGVKYVASLNSFNPLRAIVYRFLEIDANEKQNANCTVSLPTIVDEESREERELEIKKAVIEILEEDIRKCFKESAQSMIRRPEYQDFWEPDYDPHNYIYDRNFYKRYRDYAIGSSDTLIVSLRLRGSAAPKDVDLTAFARWYRLDLCIAGYSYFDQYQFGLS